MNPIAKAFNFPEEILSNYDILQEMGRGAFSTVYKIKSKSDNAIYCLKKINIRKTPDRKNEINILSKLNHPNLVKYITSYEDEEGIYIIMEFCIYGDLYSLLHMVKKKKVYVNEEIIWDIAYQCLLGLEYLHSQQIIHRDIKLLNIFMSKNKIVKIGDMGMSKILSKKEMKLSRVGTPLFLAPELVMKEKYDYKADIWSLGCSIYHLAKTTPPFNDENLIRLGQSIVNDDPPELPGCYSNELKNFVSKLMTKNKKMRPSATEALQLIPEKIINKYDRNKNNKSLKTLNSDDKKKGNKEIKNNNSKEKNKNIMNNQNSIDKQNNSPSTEIKNELVSGQTFYKFFRKNSEKSQKKISSSLLGLKKGKKSSNMFDSKNMNSILIMSKTMGGTRDFFFHNKKNSILTPNPNLRPQTQEEKKVTKFELERQKEQKMIDNKNISKTKPSIIETDKKIELDINNNNQKSITIATNISRENDFRNKGFHLSNRNKEIKKLQNFFYKKKPNKANTGINFFNHNALGLYKSYQRENQKNKNYEIDAPIKFPLIKPIKTSKIIKHFNNNLIMQNNIEQNFRKTANSFNFNNKLTIHDLK